MSEMSPRQRLLTALRGGRPDRVPCSPHIIRWIRHHWGCTCPDHQAKLADDFGLDLPIQYGALYVYQDDGKMKHTLPCLVEIGGYILGTAEAIAPETPAESLRAASEAARQFGVYR